MTTQRKLIIVLAAGLFGFWIATNFGELARGQHWPIRMVLGAAFGTAILLRRKPHDVPARRSTWLTPVTAVLGLLLVLSGLIGDVGQLRWLGILLLVHSCLRWALPPKYSRDLLLSILLFYWLHPLPSQVFGSFQLAMQNMSVCGTEWLLHCRNTRVWADAMTLETGVRTFGVPEACSGMRTALTVLLCTLGTGILFRMRWFQMALIVVAGLAQALALNILRIFFMVSVADSKPDAWSGTFLHDSAGILLIAAIFLVQLEVSLWASYRAKRQSRLEMYGNDPLGAGFPAKISLFPPAVTRALIVVTVCLLLLGAGAATAYKRRPFHRAMMIDGVVDRLVWQRRLADAERAIAQAIAYVPDDRDLQTKRVKILLLRGEYEQALSRLDPDPPADWRSFYTVLRARALTGLGRRDEAMSLIRSLPQDVQSLPALSMIVAEHAAMNGDTSTVAINIVRAAKWHVMIDRVRALFPYLAEAEHWDAIAAAGTEKAFTDVTNALLAVHAHVKINDIQGAKDLLETAMEQWPDEPAFARYLAAIARKESEKLWNEPLADKVDDIVSAVDIHAMIHRVRALFPYLAVRRQWETIASCDSSVPYQDPTNALVSVHAHLKLSDFAGAWDVLQPAMEQWPDETHFLECLASMVVAKPGMVWERAYEDSLAINSDALAADELSGIIESSFWMSRPDLAWSAYLRLKEIDPTHPDLHLAPARFGDMWFLFRKHYAGIPSDNEYDKVDLSLFYFASRDWQPAPLFEELVHGDPVAIYAKYLAGSLDSFKARDEAGTLTPWMQGLYAIALRAAGRAEEAQERQLLLDEARAGLDEMVEAMDTARILLSSDRAKESWRVVEEALAAWPGDAGLINSIGALASSASGHKIEPEMESLFGSALDSYTGDQLWAWISVWFTARRPDLAWRTYNRLNQSVPDHPGLLLAPVVFSDDWFVFRRELAGLHAPTPMDLIDLKTLYAVHLDWPALPLAQELSDRANREEQRARHLDLCLEELEKREQAGHLSLRMQFTYAAALGLAGSFDEAHHRLDLIAEAHPDQREELLLRHADIYYSEKRWADLYETLKAYSAFTAEPRLRLSLMLIDALVHLDLPVYAENEARKASQTFPEAPEILQVRAGLHAVFGEPEEALHLLGKIEGYVDGYYGPGSLPGLFLETGRITEASRVRDAFGLGKLPRVTASTQPVLLPRAELTLMTPDSPLASTPGGPVMPPSSGRSAFLDRINALKTEMLDARGATEGDVDLWSAAGDTDGEKAAALGELARLLVVYGLYGEADSAAQFALKTMPGSALMWRIRIACTGGEPAVIEAARRDCPEDHEIWLASLVSRARSQGAGSWATDEIASMAANDTYSAGAIVRAGDFMLRQGMTNAAAAAAREAISHGRGLVPAYVLGLNCAMSMNDLDWALSCALGGSRHAADPWPFFRVIAEIETSLLNTDAGTAGVLEKLRTEFPGETRWAKKLGDVYFRRGEPDQAFKVLSPLLAEQPERLELRTVLLAAEAARKAGELSRAIDILEDARSRWPDDRFVLNNLVYTMALSEDTLPGAKALLPELLDMWGDKSFVALDTAAVVSLQAGELQAARDYLSRALSRVKEMPDWWVRMNPHVIDLDVYEAKDLSGQGSWDPADAALRRDLLSVVRDLRSRMGAE